MKTLFHLYLLLVSALVTSQTFDELTIEEQLEDISFIKTELELLHPGLFTYQTKTEFEEAFKTLKESLQKNQTVFEFYNNLIPVINQVGCGHTTSKISSKSLKIVQKKKKYIPLRIAILNGKMYITETLIGTNELFSGLEIVSINNISVPQFLESNLNRYPSDGRIQSRKYQMLEKYFSEDFSKFYDTSDFFKIEVRNNNQTNTVSLKGISYQELLSKTSIPELEAMELTLMDSLATAIITVRNSKSKKVFENFLTIHLLQSKLKILNN